MFAKSWIPLVVIYICHYGATKIGSILQLDGYYGATTWSLIKY